MAVSKLNCSACGAPISVNEGVDTIKCGSCGSSLHIERGEGFIALKLVEKISKTIEETGNDLRENAQVTLTELKRMQLSNDLNASQMQLTTLQSEIRMLERSQQNYTSKLQLLSLHASEYQNLDRIRILTKQLSSPKPDDLDGCRKFGEWELAWLNTEVNSIRRSNHPQMKKILHDLSELINQTSQYVLNLKVKVLENTLPSFTEADPNIDDPVRLAVVLDLLEADKKKVRRVQNTPEGKVVLDKIIQRQKRLKQTWNQLENQRAASTALSPIQKQSSTEVIESNKVSFLSIGKGLLLGLLSLVGFLIVGVILFVIFFNGKTSITTSSITILIFCLALGVSLGSYIFLRWSCVSFIIVSKLVIRSKDNKTGISNLGVIKILVTICLIIIIYFWLVTLAIAIGDYSPTIMVLIILIGLVAAPVLAVIAAKKTELV
jgi:hypothetical protein